LIISYKLLVLKAKLAYTLDKDMAENKERIIQEENIKTGELNKIVDVEITGKEPLPREVMTWMEKVEQTSQTPITTVNDDNGQPILTPATPQNPKIVLPIDRKTFIEGFKKTVEDAGKWLSVFIFRLIKIKKGNVKFKEE
jgi:hypothetical protein